ncbi:Predicted phosphohydrolase, MPP superfamily [Eubacterium ruminantium]|uniref:Predicted phosphohydrolase, MPP superfamily n=1 Tax=Eubacterium ruminantium TaxID=42322 RepID=A0A1T4KJN7_9FIRM|nr:MULTISPECIES: metallophosphoesterase [Eubacterium]MCR5367067.1 metallophosphoesterase [Eubacterium sp.]SCW32611.1 Predicted phosphohydrolase, MPP superfamily [Eubacterium ruminantium]SDM28494.1 Predicted phosphohydrolase, MPP superfamily [Eubacterium ruminantium]SJZ42629.1 Predicted phosphohydrolase, MPP superfamily [Eubacterium ruminantium]
MWIAIFGIALFLMLGALIYIFKRFRYFRFVQKFSKEDKKMSGLIRLIPIVGFVIYGIFDLVNAAIVLIHLAIIWMIADLVAFILKKITSAGKKEDEAVSETAAVREEASEATAVREEASETAAVSEVVSKSASEPASDKKVYWPGLIAFAVTCIYLTIGYYFAHHLYETDYNLRSDKDIGGKLVIAQVSDSHVGATFDGNGFKKRLERIQKKNPDILVITGDFVDDGTTRKDMEISCKALGDFKAKYGVYFIYGNHDKGYYNSRDFSVSDLVRELEKNNVYILQDEAVLIEDRFYLVGRQDASVENRMEIKDIVKNLDKDKYIIVLDHQPNDYDNEEAAEVDLVLSGHTHGGQMFPIGIIGEKLFKANDKTYGLEKRGKTTFIVNSGISDWEIKFKTGTIAEYGIITIEGK